MVEVEGNFGGEIKLDPIRFFKILKKRVMKNNETSGKVNIPPEYIEKEVIILLPKLKGVNA